MDDKAKRMADIKARFEVRTRSMPDPSGFGSEEELESDTDRQDGLWLHAEVERLTAEKAELERLYVQLGAESAALMLERDELRAAADQKSQDHAPLTFGTIDADDFDCVPGFPDGEFEPAMREAFAQPEARCKDCIIAGLECPKGYVVTDMACDCGYKGQMVSAGCNDNVVPCPKCGEKPKGKYE